MGCGSSSSTGVVTKPQPVHNHQPVSSAKGKDIKNPTNHATTNYHQNDQFSHDMNGNLPPPRPPEQTREELLADKMDLMKRMDKHAKEVSFDAAKSENLENFTKKTLIPPRQEQHTTTTVKITEDKPEPKTLKTPESKRQTTPAVDKAPPRPPPQPLDLSLNQDEVEDVTAQIIKQHKEQNELQKRKQDVARIRQNASLQEKLMQRREAKRKREIAEAAAASETTASLDRDESARVAGGVTLDSTNQAGILSAEGEASLVAPGDASRSLYGIQKGSDVEAAEDKYNEVMAEPAPMPVAPETRKEVIYGNEKNIELFKDLEDFAVNLEQISDPSVTFGILMDNLLINQLSDLEKVRILFHWITSQNLNSIVFPNNIQEDTPMGFLLAIKQDRKSYAELFCRLCSAAGLHAKVIRGYLKGVGYLPDHKFIGQNDPFSGSWNAVLINQQWRLIDTHWGARHVIEMDGVISENWATEYKYEEHYFLTNPDQLINTHFPFEKDWQLLAKPITLDEYQDITKVWPLFYKVQLELHSHKHGVITAEKDGVVEIRLKSSELTRQDADLKCELVTKQRARQIGNFELACYTFQYVEGDYQVFRVHIPQTGEYLLKIFAMSKKYSDDATFTNVCFYQINCPKLTASKFSPKNLKDIKVPEIQAPFPVVNMPWGPPVNPDLIRVIPVSHLSPVISCDEEGEATVIMETLRGNDNYFSALLASVGNGTTNNVISNRVVHFITVTTERRRLVVFRVRTPTVGIYSLTLYHRPNDHQKQENAFTGFCNYLVISHAQSKPAPQYPPVANGALGPVDIYCQQLGLSPVGSRKLTLTSHGISYDSASAWIEADENGEAFISFDNLQPMNVLVDMQGAAGQSPDLTNRVIVQNLHEKTSIVLRPPRRTDNDKEFVVKIYASPLIVTSGIPTVFHCFVSSSKTMATQFPSIKSVGCTKHMKELDLSISKYSNSEPMFGQDSGTENINPFPCRMYKGGDDFILTFAKKTVVNFSVNVVDLETSTEAENCALISGNSLSAATLRIRIPKPGSYLATVFAAPLGEQSLSLVHSIWIKATSASFSSEKYPQTFGIWSSNFVELFYPLSKTLKRNSVNKIKIALAMLSPNGSGWMCQPFPNVLMLTDQSAPVYPNKYEKEGHIFEWDYVPGPGEQNLSVVAQTSSTDQSLSYVLKFDVVD